MEQILCGAVIFDPNRRGFHSLGTCALHPHTTDIPHLLPAEIEALEEQHKPPLIFDEEDTPYDYYKPVRT